MSGHQWISRFGLRCCQLCGFVRRADGNNKPCPGPVRIGLRSRSKDANDDAQEKEL